MAALKRVLEPAFSGAAAAAQMLTVKDFLLLSCLALGGSTFCCCPTLHLMGNFLLLSCLAFDGQLSAAVVPCVGWVHVLLLPDVPGARGWLSFAVLPGA